MYRINSRLWDKIHHFAGFPQTGGVFLINTDELAVPFCAHPESYASLAPADGSVRAEPVSGDTPPC